MSDDTNRVVPVAAKREKVHEKATVQNASKQKLRKTKTKRYFGSAKQCDFINTSAPSRIASPKNRRHKKHIEMLKIFSSGRMKKIPQTQNIGAFKGAKE